METTVITQGPVDVPVSALPDFDAMTAQQRELYELMSDISEDCYCAGWMTGLEFAIWGALQDGDRRYGMGEMDAEQLEGCRALANELDGWVIWVDDDDVPGLPNEQWGPRFVPMARWLRMLPANSKAQGREPHRGEASPGATGSAAGDSEKGA